jgi:hypothetical protein
LFILKTQKAKSQHGKYVIFFVCSVILATVLTEKEDFIKDFNLQNCVGEKKKRFSRVVWIETKTPVKLARKKSCFKTYVYSWHTYEYFPHILSIFKIILISLRYLIVFFFFQSLSGHTTPVECVRFGHTEELVCAGSASGALKIWDLVSLAFLILLFITVFTISKTYLLSKLTLKTFDIRKNISNGMK